MQWRLALFVLLVAGVASAQSRYPDTSVWLTTEGKTLRQGIDAGDLGGLQSTDIDTLAELDAIVADALLVEREAALTPGELMCAVAGGVAGRAATGAACAGACVNGVCPIPSDLTGIATGDTLRWDGDEFVDDPGDDTLATTYTVDSDNTGGSEPANGAGLVIEGGSGDVTFLYDSANDRMNLSTPACFAGECPVTEADIPRRATFCLFEETAIDALEDDFARINYNASGDCNEVDLAASGSDPLMSLLTTPTNGSAPAVIDRICVYAWDFTGWNSENQLTLALFEWDPSIDMANIDNGSNDLTTIILDDATTTLPNQWGFGALTLVGDDFCVDDLAITLSTTGSFFGFRVTNLFVDTDDSADIRITMTVDWRMAP